MRALARASMDKGAAGVMIAPPSSLRTDDQIVGYYAHASSNSSASGISCSVGSPQWPSSIASVNAYEIPARSRIIAVFSIRFIAIASAL